MIRCLLILLGAASVAGAQSPFDEAQLATVKVYGAGGVAGLEGYQTGVFLDREGLVLTADSVALDGGPVTLVDALGDRSEASFVARDARTGLVLLSHSDEVVPPASLRFDLTSAPARGDRVWVLSNAFNIAAGAEPVTVQRARVAVTAPIPLADDAAPRPGTPAAGQRVLLLDVVTSNPGVAGGPVVDGAGEAVGVLGAECRSPLTGAWISYAVPAAAVVEAVERMQSGSGGERDATPPGERAWRAALWERGIALVPSLDRRTPPYVEAVAAGSPAEAAGLLADDLVIAVNDAPVATAAAAGRALSREAAGKADRVTVLRDDRIKTLTLERNTTP